MPKPVRKTQRSSSGRFSNLFGYAKELKIDKDRLSEGAAEWTGKPSLCSLNAVQIRQYENALRARVQTAWHSHRRSVASQFERHATLTAEQYTILIDLITAVFGDLLLFRSWLTRYFMLNSESFIDSGRCRAIVVALQDMRSCRWKPS